MTLPKTMYPGMVNSPETTITNNINESDTIIYVLDPARVPEPPNLMTLGTGTNAETVKVLEINDNAITVERGFQGVAKSWPAGTVIARNFTEYDYGALKENIEDLEANKETLAGAQAKANAAENAAKQYADQRVNALAGEGNTKTVKQIDDELASHLAETVTDGVHGMGAAAEQDYEEGIFTPELMFGGSSEGINQGARRGEYTRIGRIVHIEIEFRLGSKGLATGQAQIYGLPFISPSSYPVRCLTIGQMHSVSLPSNFVYPSAIIYENVAHINLRYTNNAGVINDFTNSHFNDDTRIVITGTYRIS